MQTLTQCTRIVFGLFLTFSVVPVPSLYAEVEVAVTAATFPWVSGERVLFLGDSITQDGRYVSLVEAYLWAAYPERNIDIVNAGLSSETVSGMTEPVHPFPRPNIQDRLPRALELAKPDWVVVCYGMNDGIYHPAEPRIIDAYRNGLIKVIDEISAHGARVILLTPPSFDADANAVKMSLNEAQEGEPYGYKKPYSQYDQTLIALSEVVQSLRDHKGVERVIDIHAATDRYLRRVKYSKPDYQYGDGIHPPIDGHLAIAAGLLGGLGCDSPDVQAKLRELTGIAPPIGDQVQISEQQSSFCNALFSRSAARSAAYRNTIGAAATLSPDDVALPNADKAAAKSQASLRVAVADPFVVAPYREAAIKKWNADIEKLEALDKAEPDPNDGILFIGSSSIRLWENIAKDMLPYAAISRGYGGAKYSDLAVFTKRLVTPHHYRALVVFVGNDISGSDQDQTPEEVAKLARYVCDVSLEHQPDAPVFLIEVTPTPLRFKHWSKIVGLNTKLREISLTKPGTHFIATAEHYLDDFKQPRAELFRQDRLHQNDAGYAQWCRLLKRHLDDLLTQKPTEPSLNSGS